MSKFLERNRSIINKDLLRFTSTIRTTFKFPLRWFLPLSHFDTESLEGKRWLKRSRWEGSRRGPNHGALSLETPDVVPRGNGRPETDLSRFPLAVVLSSPSLLLLLHLRPVLSDGGTHQPYLPDEETHFQSRGRSVGRDESEETDVKIINKKRE